MQEQRTARLRSASIQTCGNRSKIQITLLCPGIEINATLTLLVPNPLLLSELIRLILHDISFPTLPAHVSEQELTELRFDIFNCVAFVLEDTGSSPIRDIA